MRTAILLALVACSHPKAKTDGGPGSDGAPPADADPQCPAPMIPAMKVVTVATGLARPVVLAAPKGSTDLYVVEEVGRIRIIRDGVTLPTPFLDVTGTVYSPGGPVAGEAGLLGLAFAPDYATSGTFYVYLTVQLGGQDSAGVYAYHRSAGNPDVADPTATPILEHAQNDYNNIAGHLAFGADGFLYASIGDGASVPSAAAELGSPRGKILRIDPAHPTQAVPGNMTGGEPHVWDLGLRNPYRFSFDRVTGDLYIGEAGEDHYDEIEIEAKGTGHHDYGWPRYSGTHCEDGSTSCGSPGVFPALEIAHAPVSSVVIGGAVYRGAALPCLRGRYLYTMHGLGTIQSFVWTGATITDPVELTDRFTNADLFSISSISEDAAGELYFTTLPGVVYKLVPN